ncbi:DUF3344 domain-containing protein [Streptomyces echinoruber]|uniref:DUF3344 domain-containing protein n=1 Tax=Streptomyces echinoruber TaxID=68898 RepID=A0A918QZE9_9ACTN|nr:DUF3344 domain-containing protein [Streptomyces echinoruber]GGZ78527.1 hypothetical protein GCM10010389_15080 [Streptomyces echinoruber]
MRTSPGPLLRRAAAGALVPAVLWAPVGARAAAPAPAVKSGSVPLTQRYHALQHGGVVRAANTTVSCRTVQAAAVRPSCPAVRAGAQAVNGALDMFYVDVDHDPNTYNSSRAELRLPAGSRVTYARLYWGGNLRVGEQKPPRDNRRVLIAEPSGAYRQVLADTVVGHRTALGADAFQASADVTRLVRVSGPGMYTVAQVNAAMGRSAAGAWGGWTLVVAYEKRAEPLRHLSLWDGFEALYGGRSREIRLRDLTVPRGARGLAGLVAYDGDRATRGDALTFTPFTRAPAGGSKHHDGRSRSAHRPSSVPLRGPANPGDDVLNSTISEPGSRPARREPAYATTLGYDSDVFDLTPALRRGGARPALRLVSRRDVVWSGVFFTAVDARR